MHTVFGVWIRCFEIVFSDVHVFIHVNYVSLKHVNYNLSSITSHPIFYILNHFQTDSGLGGGVSRERDRKSTSKPEDVLIKVRQYCRRTVDYKHYMNPLTPHFIPPMVVCGGVKRFRFLVLFSFHTINYGDLIP